MRKKIATVDTVAYQGRAIIEFHPSRHFYTCSVPALEKWHVYQVGVTTAIGIKDKSGPLCGWAVNQCEVFVQQRIADNVRSYMTNDDILATARQMKAHYRNVKAKAAEIGVVVHDYLHEVLLAKQNNGISPDRPGLSESIDADMLGKINNSIDAGLEFFEKHKLIPLTMERPTWSSTYGYIGTGDFIGILDSELAVVDYKTSKELYPEVFLQTAAYQEAYSEEYPDSRRQFLSRWGVNVGKDGRLDAKRRCNKIHFENDFQAFLAAKQLWHWNRVENGGWPIEIVGSLDGIPAVEEEEWDAL